MTVGIYALYWEEQDLIYIGQSVNIERRYKDHLVKLKAQKHSNYLVQEAYTKYSIPKLHIIEVCSLSELNDKEIKWTVEFNSINTGLNIVEPGEARSGFGTNCGASKYSRYKILKVFSMLYKSLLPYYKISQKLNVPIGLVSSIANKISHTWLQVEYPKQYNLMIDNKSIRRIKNNIALTTNYNYPNIISPEGIEYSVEHIIPFCREHFPNDTLSSTRTSLGKLLNGRKSSWRGWRVRSNG